MRNGLPSPYALQVFEAAARHLSFTRAAEKLGLTQGAISHQIKVLEADLGVLLFDRSGRSVCLTRQGVELLPVVRESFAQIREIVGSIRREAATSPSEVSIATTTYFASRWLSQRLAGFMVLHPEVAIRLVHAAAAGMQRPAADLEVRWGDGRWPDLSARLLFEAELAPVCSPSLIAGRAERFTVLDLEGQAFLHDDETQAAWRRWRNRAGVADPGVIPGPVIVDPNVRMQAAIDGQGFALADSLIHDELASGRLVAPLHLTLPGYGYFLLDHGADPLPPAVVAFVDWIVNVARDAPPLAPIGSGSISGSARADGADQ